MPLPLAGIYDSRQTFHAIAMPKVLVADKISPTGVALLKAQPGYEVVEAYGSTPEQVLNLVADVDAILVRSETQITREVLAAAQRLVCVGREIGRAHV